MGAGDIGESLRSRRQQLGITLADVESATKIRSDYIAALESEKFTELPGEVYTLGFLKIYARMLYLDPEAIATQYRSLYQKPEDGDVPQGKAPVNANRASSLTAGISASGANRGPDQPHWRQLSVIAVHFQRVWQALRDLAISNKKLVLGSLAVIVCLLLAAFLIKSARSRTAQTLPIAAKPKTEQVAPSPPPQQNGVMVTVYAREQCWAQVEVDGSSSYTGIMQPGDTKVFQGKESIRMDLGNAGGVILYYNGAELPPLGREWVPVTEEFTKESGANPVSPVSASNTDETSTQGSGA